MSKELLLKELSPGPVVPKETIQQVTNGVASTKASETIKFFEGHVNKMNHLALVEEELKERSYERLNQRE